MSIAQDFVTSFMKKLAGSDVTLTPALQNVFAKILANQVVVAADGEVTFKGGFDALSKIFTFIATPAAGRPSTGPTSYNEAAVTAAKNDAAAENDLTVGGEEIPTEEPTEEPTDGPTDEPTEEPGVEAETFSLTAALEAQEAGELPAAYRIEDTLTAPAIETTLAQAQANIDAAKAGYVYSEEEQAILDGAASTEISITVAYSLTNAAGNLGTLTVAEAQLVAGAENAGDYQFTVPVNADDVVGISAEGPVTEGNEIDFTVTMAEAVNFDRTVEFVIEGVETATSTKADPLADLGIREGVIHIPAGETTGVLTLTPIDDNITEGREAFVVKLLNSDGTEVIANSNTVVIRDPENAGQTFVLTTGIDTGSAFVGGAGNDTFNAFDGGAIGTTATFSQLDSLDGGAGNDVLNIIQTTAIANIPSATVKNIETVNLETAAGATLDTRTWTGLETLNLNKAAGAVALTAASTTDVNVSGVVETANTIAVTGGKDVTLTHAGVAGTAHTGITVNGAVNVNVTSTGSLAEDGGITLGGTTANTGAINVQQSGNGNLTAGGNTGGALDTIAVTGGTTITVNQDVTAIDNIATAAAVGDVVTQGAVTVTAGNTTTAVTVTQDDQVAAVAAVAGAGAAQTQTVTFTALAALNSVTVNGLTFTASKNLTAGQVAQAFANLTSGDRQDAGGPTANGIYTGVNTATTYTTGAANGATVTYTAHRDLGGADSNGAGQPALAPTVLQNGGLTAPTAPTAVIATAGVAHVAAVTGVAGVANGLVTINDNATKSITTVTVDGYSAGATLGNTSSLDAITTLNLSNSGAGAATLHTASTGALTLNLVDVDAAVSIDGTAATVTNLTINTSGTASTGAITAAAATTVTINAEAALSGASTFTAATLIDVNGSARVDLAGATTNAATLATIDASGNTGGVTAVLGATNSVKFTGGTGNDSLTLGNANIAVGKDIDMGAGNDTLTIAAGTTAATILGTVTGGEGTDTLSMGFADAVAVSATGAFHAKVTGFEHLTINNVAGNDDDTATTNTVNLANLAYNYVTVNGTVTDGDAHPGESDTLALTGMAANGTVAFGAGSTATSLYTVALADATGGADVLNYVLASTDSTAAAKDGIVGTANNAGTITANAIETFNITSTAVDLDGATNVITANGDSVKAINLSGNAGVNLTSAATTLKTVDASGLTGTGVAGGLVFTASNASMTVTGGAGNDVINIVATAGGGTFNGGEGNDTFVIASGADLITLDGGAGNDIFDFNGVSTNKSNFAVISGVNAGDTLDFAGLVGGAPATTFTAARITLSQGATESTQAYLDQAVTTLAQNGFGWFQFNGNTYIAGDVGGTDSANAFADGQDFVVMITGLVDLSTASFNASSATLEIA